MKRGVVFCLFFVLSSLAFADPDFEAGLEAYKKYDYATAMQIWLPLAEHGDASAQYRIGDMYAFGQGVVRSDADALKWYGRSADNGLPVALNFMGTLYEHGSGVVKNLNKAEEYFQLAMSQASKQNRSLELSIAKKNLARVHEKMTCLNKASTLLFDEALLCTTQEELRTATVKAGARVIRVDDNYLYDQYDSSQLLEGSSSLYIAYFNSKFAKAFYYFDSKSDLAKVVEVRDMVASKYGKPTTSTGQQTVGPMIYIWKLKDGINIEVSRDWPDAIVYLTYVHQVNNAAMEAEEERVKRAEEDQKRNKQSHAF